MLSIQTNVNSLVAQENLSVNNTFQSKTIQRLTSGFRINSSADDAAGLAVANGFRNNVAELTQGVQNANNGVGQLQIIDGGLTNISNILDRLQTLATESASTTFTGNRSTLNTEYQSLLGEINRQATNVNLDSNGTFKSVLNIYIGGAASADSNAQVSVDLSKSAVDVKGLNLTGTSVQGGGTGFASNTTQLNDTQGLFDVGAAGGANHEDFTVSYVDANGAAQQQTVSVNAQAGGYTGTQFITALNNSITNAGITGVTAQIGGDGTLQFQGSGAFTVAHAVTGAVAAPSVAGAATQSLTNLAEYNVSAAFTGFSIAAGDSNQSETVKLTTGGKDYNITLTSDNTSANYAGTQDQALTVINSALAGSGVTAIKDGANISFQGNSGFTVNVTNATVSDGAGGGPDAGNLFGSAATFTSGAILGAQTVTAGNSANSSTGDALAAINAVSAAVQSLGQVQGRVGAGENQLNYAISLAQSQITNFTSAGSNIRDADIATEAANLSKSQVLQQASIAAMAQANSAPQQVLTLLRG